MAAASTPTGETPPTALPQQLHSLLLDLSAHPYPHVPNPPGLEKRASVALILRIQPRYSHWPGDDSATSTTNDSFHDIQASDSDSSSTTPRSTAERLSSFFAQDWVRYGDPEVLFIKRAHRAGDRWTAHVALPGGRRDPEDADDRAAAVRETWEEVGIKLDEDEGDWEHGESKGNCIAVGNLPERVVTTSWGKVPLMVLCPYIFLLTTPSPPTLRLQPTEVGSAHWVSIRALLSPARRTHWHEDVSNRLARQESGLKRAFLRLMLGDMVFAAVHLLPSISVYCSTTPGFVTVDGAVDGVDAAVDADTAPDPTFAHLPTQHQHDQHPPQHPPLLLWGLTLGILADFLVLVPPHTALQQWTYPTFSPLDLRFALWALSWRFRRERARALEGEEGEEGEEEEEGEEGEEREEGEEEQEEEDDRGEDREEEKEDREKRERHEEQRESGDGEACGGALDVGALGMSLGLGSKGRTKTDTEPATPNSRRRSRRVRRGSGVRRGRRVESSKVGVLLEGYYDIVRTAVGLVVVGRMAVLGAVVLWGVGRGRGWWGRGR